MLIAAFDALVLAAAASLRNTGVLHAVGGVVVTVCAVLITLDGVELDRERAKDVDIDLPSPRVRV